VTALPTWSGLEPCVVCGAVPQVQPLWGSTPTITNERCEWPLRGTGPLCAKALCRDHARTVPLSSPVSTHFHAKVCPEHYSRTCRGEYADSQEPLGSLGSPGVVFRTAPGPLTREDNGDGTTTLRDERTGAPRIIMPTPKAPQ
jgi:hypothetical protein